jgi:hypothetical protein
MEIRSYNSVFEFSLYCLGVRKQKKSWEPLLKSQKQKVTFHSSMQILVSLLTNWLLIVPQCFKLMHIREKGNSPKKL